MRCLSFYLQNKFNEAKDLVAKFDKKTPKKGEDKKDEKSGVGGSVDLFAKLKPKAGSWECQGCYVSNPPEVRGVWREEEEIGIFVMSFNSRMAIDPEI